jgi:hypothetical protein
VTRAGEKGEWLTGLYFRRPELQVLYESGELAVMRRLVELETLR